ncbi:hypothetical protein BASA60_011014 [Batrachochytrium salamandrivorans]|nr:hypothetical protein BASA60_011014 [Batrachochytrium salamandrivorans]
MKFNALVVAAMVIASVNAGGADELPSGDENSGGRSTTVVAEGSSGNGQNIPQISDPKELPICEGLERRLGDLWNRANEIEAGFHGQLPGYLNLMKGLDLNGDKIEESQVGSEQAAGYSALSGRERVILTNFDHDYNGVMEDYGMTWGELSRKCSAESLGVLSLEEMLEHGLFLQFPDADGVIASSEQ